MIVLLFVTSFNLKSLANTTPKVEDSEYIYLDLALGNVTLSSENYQGTVYVDGVATVVSGDSLK